MTLSVAMSHIGAILTCLILATLALVEGQQCSYAISIQLIGADHDEYLCDGALITGQDVLTMAECVYRGDVIRDAAEFRVLLSSISGANQPHPIARSVAALWLHPQYTPGGGINNLAALRLNESLNFSDGFAPLQLANDYNPIESAVCTICGWQATVSTGRYISKPILKDQNPSHINMTYCSRTDANNVALLEALICTGTDTGHEESQHFRRKGSLLVCDARLRGLSLMTGEREWFNGTALFLDIMQQQDWIIDRTQARVIPVGGTVVTKHVESVPSHDVPRVKFSNVEAQMLTDPQGGSGFRRGSMHPYGNDPDVTWQEIRSDSTVWLVAAPITILIFIVLILLYRSFSGRPPKYCNIL